MFYGTEIWLFYPIDQRTAEDHLLQPNNLLWRTKFEESKLETAICRKVPSVGRSLFFW
jgi:hypothetical protein